MVKGGDARFSQLQAVKNRLLPAFTAYSVHSIGNFNIFWVHRHPFYADGLCLCSKSGVKLPSSNLLYFLITYILPPPRTGARRSQQKRKTWCMDRHNAYYAIIIPGPGNWWSGEGAGLSLCQILLLPLSHHRSALPVPKHPSQPQCPHPISPHDCTMISFPKWLSLMPLLQLKWRLFMRTRNLPGKMLLTRPWTGSLICNSVFLHQSSALSQRFDSRD